MPRLVGEYLIEDSTPAFPVEVEYASELPLPQSTD